MNNQTKDFVTTILLSLSLGTFIYITFFEVSTVLQRQHSILHPNWAIVFNKNEVDKKFTYPWYSLKSMYIQQTAFSLVLDAICWKLRICIVSGLDFGFRSRSSHFISDTGSGKREKV